jgi:hypothetical protein
MLLASPDYCVVGWFYRLTLGPAPSSLRFLLAAFILFDPGDEKMLTLRRPVAFIRSQPGLFRIRVAADPEPDFGEYYAVQSLWGGGATIMTDFSRFMVRDDLLNVRCHTRPAATPDAGPIYHDSFWKVCEDTDGYPRAWLAHQAIPARFRSCEADSMPMDVNTTGTALLVVSELFYRAATVNGEPAEIHKRGGALRALFSGAGTAPTGRPAESSASAHTSGGTVDPACPPPTTQVRFRRTPANED